MTDETVTALDKLSLPWGKEVEVQKIVYESGLTMLRLRIREGRRFTIIDLDGASAGRLGGMLADWAKGVGDGC